jgi:predicted alpha/beta-hydrolase family hydrolase
MHATFTVDLGDSRVTTSGRRYDPPGSSSPVCTLVLAHGAGAPQTHPWMVGAAEGLASRGVRVVTFNFPYMEQKRRAPDSPAVAQACFRSVVAHTRADLGEGVRVFLGGKSFGGRMASHLAADREPAVAGLVCLGYPLHPPGKPDLLRVKHLCGIAVPVLIVQGSRDTFGTPGELRPHLAAIKAPVTLHVVEGGDHSFRQPKKLAPDPKAALDGLLDVIALWLRQPAPR